MTRETVIEGDADDLVQLNTAMVGQNIVYVNLSGQLVPKVKKIISAMKDNAIIRLIYISVWNIYHEVPQPLDNMIDSSVGALVMNDSRMAAKLVEDSTLTYTIIRPSGLTDSSEVNYELTYKGEPFRGQIVSRSSVADYVLALINNPQLDLNKSVGISQV